jgi:hypothetical protein
MSLKSRPPLGGKWGHGLTSLSNVTKTSEGAGGHFVDVTHGEQIEMELDAFISKRDKKRRTAEGERPAEESYERNLRAHSARRALSVLYEWRAFHHAQRESNRRNFEILDARHAADLERVEREIERRMTA